MQWSATNGRLVVMACRRGHRDLGVYAPISGRAAKPRVTGLTMVIDKGLGPARTGDLLQTAADYVDFIKFGFGTALLYTPDVLRRKLQAIRDAGVDAYPGGTMLEVAVHQQNLSPFLQWCRAVGFSFIEVSDGTIELSRAQRTELIRGARDMGFGVLSEVGKKDPLLQPAPDRIAEQVATDLHDGAFKVIVEGRDAGRNIGIYDEAGRVREALYEAIVGQLHSIHDVIWEAPQSAQQQALLERIGPNANFGNVQPEDVISLEAMRVGLRGDTLRLCLAGNASDRAGFRQTV